MSFVQTQRELVLNPGSTDVDPATVNATVTCTDASAPEVGDGACQQLEAAYCPRRQLDEPGRLMIM